VIREWPEAVMLDPAHTWLWVTGSRRPCLIRGGHLLAWSKADTDMEAGER